MDTIAVRNHEIERSTQCEPRHPGGVHLNPREAEAVRELFRRYATGTTTLSQLAEWMNNQGFRTRNRHRVQDETGKWTQEPRYFTTASIRGVLHNVFYAGKIKHRDQILPGAHEPLVSEALFQTVESTLRRNSGRSQTLQAKPEREYLLKGLIRCAHCLLPMWAQTYSSGNRYYREQKGSRGTGFCVGKSRSILCSVPDDEIGRIVGAIVLPEAWIDKVLAKVLLADEVKRVHEERQHTEQRLKRLGRAFVDGLYSEDDYRREKWYMDEKLGSLVIPGVDAAREAGDLLGNLPDLWHEADLSGRRKLLMSMLDAVFVDTVNARSIMAIKPKPAFRAIFEIAGICDQNGRVLICRTRQTQDLAET